MVALKGNTYTGADMANLGHADITTGYDGTSRPRWENMWVDGLAELDDKVSAAQTAATDAATSEGAAASAVVAAQDAQAASETAQAASETAQAASEAARDQALVAAGAASRFVATAVGGTANALTLTCSPTCTTLAHGAEIVWTAASDNTGAVTLALDGLAAVALKDPAGAALSAGSIKAGSQYAAIYTGTEFRTAGGGAIDNVPAAFTFTDLTDVALSTAQTSNAITITGIDGAAAVTVSGDASSYWRKSTDGGVSWGQWTTAAGSAAVNDQIEVKHTSSGTTNSTVNTTLTVGGVSDTFSSTTSAASGYAYQAGGNAAANPAATIEKFSFVSETGSSISATLSEAKVQATGMHSGTYGYIASGGNGSGSGYVDIDRIAFADDTKTTISAALTTNREQGGLNSTTAGYPYSGYTNESTHVASIEKLVYASETQSVLSATTSAARNILSGSANSTTKGYAMGGETSQTIDGVIFASDAAFVAGGTLPVAMGSSAGANSTTKAYNLGGYTSSSKTSIVAMVFSSEAVSTLAAVLGSAQGYGGRGSSQAKGYAFGGTLTYPTHVTAVNGLKFSDETAISPSLALATARSVQASCYSSGMQ